MEFRSTKGVKRHQEQDILTSLVALTASCADTTAAHGEQVVRMSYTVIEPTPAYFGESTREPNVASSRSIDSSAHLLVRACA